MVLDKIKEYITTVFKRDEFTEQELTYASRLVKEIILEARANSLKVGDRLIGIAGDEYIVIKIQNNEYKVLNLETGKTLAFTFENLSELTLACKTWGIIKDRDYYYD